MASKIQHGLELSKQSWGALRQNHQLVLFPILSMLGMALVTILFFIPEVLLAGFATQSGEVSDVSWIAMMVVLFFYYLAAYTVVIFSNTALVGAAMKLIRGESATVGDGLRIAFSRLGKIIVYALISATIGVLARSLAQSGRSSDSIIVKLVAVVLGGLIQGAWNVVVFFAIPVLVIEDIGVGASLKRSWELFKQTWGEGFTGNVAIGGYSCLAYIIVLVVGGGLTALGVVTSLVPVTVLGSVVLLLGFLVVALLNGAVNGIFQASLYSFAMTGDAGPFIDTELAQEAFQAK